MPNEDVIDKIANVAGPAEATPGRHSFSNFDEFKAHLVENLGATVDGEGLRGSMSRKGPAQPGGPSDPVLAAISSPEGLLIIGDETIDLRDAGAPAPTDEPDVGIVAHAAPLTNSPASSMVRSDGLLRTALRWSID